MRAPLKSLRDEIAAMKAAVQARQRPDVPDFSAYRNDPIGFARDVLKVELTDDQKAVCRAAIQPPYRVMVKSGHNIGKTFVAAVLVVWWYFTRDPSVVITTAPTERDVVDLLWTEVRLLCQRAGLPSTFIGPRAPEMRTGEEHYAKGYTSNTGESFQGRHRPCMFFLFDEAEGIERTYWTTASTMFQPDGTHLWICICNPTTTTSQRFQEERAIEADGRRKWKVISLSSLDHPNILAALRGEPQPYANAVSMEQVNGWLGDFFETVAEEEIDLETDIEFPPASGRWWRPGPEGESRVLGRNPTAGTYGVWSERAWKLATEIEPLEVPLVLPEIGCDVARFGDDRTEIHWRAGPCSLGHEDHGGWDTVRTADRLMELADKLTADHNGRRPSQAEPVKATTLPIKVDDTGVGGGVTDILVSRGYNAIPVNAGSVAHDKAKYPRVRDELWFQVRDRARAGALDLTRLGVKRLAKLEVQAMAPTWLPTPNRQRVVEPKEKTKKRIGRSPDGLDALNLAYYHASGGEVATWVDTGERRSYRDRHARGR